MSQGERSKQPLLPRMVNLCAKGGCCPDAEFKDDGTVVLTEDGQTIVLSRVSAELLFDELEKRGYGW